jgi:hypothetical protein
MKGNVMVSIPEKPKPAEKAEATSSTGAKKTGSDSGK